MSSRVKANSFSKAKKSYTICSSYLSDLLSPSSPYPLKTFALAVPCSWRTPLLRGTCSPPSPPLCLGLNTTLSVDHLSPSDIFYVLLDCSVSPVNALSLQLILCSTKAWNFVLLSSGPHLEQGLAQGRCWWRLVEWMTKIDCYFYCMTFLLPPKRKIQLIMLLCVGSFKDTFSPHSFVCIMVLSCMFKDI